MSRSRMFTSRRCTRQVREIRETVNWAAKEAGPERSKWQTRWAANLIHTLNALVRSY